MEGLDRTRKQSARSGLGALVHVRLHSTAMRKEANPEPEFKTHTQQDQQPTACEIAKHVRSERCHKYECREKVVHGSS